MGSEMCIRDSYETVSWLKGNRSDTASWLALQSRAAALDVLLSKEADVRQAIRRQGIAKAVAAVAATIPAGCEAIHAELRSIRDSRVDPLARMDRLGVLAHRIGADLRRVAPAMLHGAD